MHVEPISKPVYIDFPKMAVLNNSPLPSIENALQVDMFGHTIQRPSLIELNGQTQCFGEATIPCFDLDSISRAQSLERKVLIQYFGDAWKEYGFFAVKAESLTPFITKVYEDMAAYFHLPEEVKRKDDHKNFGQTGFSWEGRETAAGNKVPDMKETFFINQEMYKDASKWPAFPETFQATMSAYHEELSKYVGQALSFLFEYLGEFPCDVEETLKTEKNLMRLAYYRPVKETDNPQAKRSAPHTDVNAITALPTATAPGLEMFKNGKWIPVIAKEGYVIINTGEQLEHLTGGLFPAITHQVNNVDSHKERLASIFFGAFAPSFSLKPLNSCVKIMTENMSAEEKETFLKKYPDVTAEDYLSSRLIEMGTIAEPGEDWVKDLRKIGLLRQAPESLKNKFPTLF